MAHPLRLRLYYALILAGSATATRLAEGIDESVSLVSYHLRQLAMHGYVEPDPEPRATGDGRERWWRPTSVGFSWTPSDFADSPEQAAVAVSAQRQIDAHRAAYRQAWLDSQSGWSSQWRDAAISSDNPLLRMTPAELTEFSEQYAALMEAWRDRLADAPDDPDREQVMVVLQAFPFRP
jgi:DNA-binding transcriptional ArsR family regulator